MKKLIVVGLLLVSGQVFAARSTGATPTLVACTTAPGHKCLYSESIPKHKNVFKRLEFWLRKI